MKTRILMVEDDIISAKIATIMFQSVDCEICHAVSGEQAIELYLQSLDEKKNYDGIYMDLGLPKKTGIETCIAIRDYEAKSRLSPIAIIAVTANEDPNVIAECLSAGMMDVIFKPLNPVKIAGFLKQCGLKN